MSGVVKSSYSNSKSGDLSEGFVRETLLALTEKGCIIKAGDATREGTLYKVNLPEEITMCQAMMKEEREKEVVQPIDENKELDYYNVPENRHKVFERDDYKCHYCDKQLTRFTATLDHIQPVSKGGDNSYDNLTTACLHCNSRRGNKPVMDMYADKEENS